MNDRCTYHHVLKCADCPAGCVGVGPDDGGTIGNDVGWKSEAEAVRDHIEGCLLFFENNLDLSPKSEREYRRTMRENIKRIKATLEVVERTIGYEKDWEFPTEMVPELDFPSDFAPEIDFPDNFAPELDLSENDFL